MNHQKYTVFSEDFFKKELIDKLNTLTPNTKPNWGIMSAQHFVEHIIGAWLISNGRFAIDRKNSKEEMKERREFLFSNKEFPKGFDRPDAPKGKLPQLRKANLQEAIESLKVEIERFFNYHQSHPNVKPVHPIFGELSKDEWLLFQSKHIKHHLKQFNLI